MVTVELPYEEGFQARLQWRSLRAELRRSGLRARAATHGFGQRQMSVAQPGNKDD